MAEHTQTPPSAPEEFIALTQAQLQALIRTNSAILQGSAELGRLWLDFWNRQLSEGMEQLRTVSSAQSFQEALERQNGFTRTSFERLCQTSAEGFQISARHAATIFEAGAAGQPEATKTGHKAA